MTRPVYTTVRLTSQCNELDPAKFSVLQIESGFYYDPLLPVFRQHERNFLLLPLRGTVSYPSWLTAPRTACRSESTHSRGSGRQCLGARNAGKNPPSPNFNVGKNEYGAAPGMGNPQH